ncbi:MAG: hypothetical protein ACI835_005299 [Planctomycetota bacterium]|jgi:hypothetical protein
MRRTLGTVGVSFEAGMASCPDLVLSQERCLSLMKIVCQGQSFRTTEIDCLPRIQNEPYTARLWYKLDTVKRLCSWLSTPRGAFSRVGVAFEKYGLER